VVYAITVKNFVILAKIFLFKKIYIAKIQRYLWHTDYPRETGQDGFFILYFLIRDNSCNPWIKVILGTLDHF
jgi:hypothetical protein